jgi:hypothetical protein
MSKTETQTPEVVELSLEKTIETKLVQSNVTEQVLGALKEKYGGMKLVALDDKESYLEIKSAAKECAKVRTLTVKICKEGREDAVKVQKLWIAKEKEIVGKVAEVEDALDAEIKKFDDNVERLANEEKQRQESAYINRQATLTKMGATYVDGCFVLGEASFEAELVKGASQNIWDDDIVPKFNEEYQKIEAVRISEENAKREAEEKVKAEAEKLRQEQESFRLEQEEFKRKQLEAENAAKEKQRQEELEKERQQSALQKKRFETLFPFNPQGIDVDMNLLWGLTDNDFDKILSKCKDEFEKNKAEQLRIDEEKKQAEIEEARQEAIKKEQARVAEEEAKRQAAIESATDKTKWDEFRQQVSNIEIYDMRSGQYRTKMQSAKEKIQQILAL